MALGNVVDMDEIKPGIEEAGHAPARRFDDDPAGRRWLHIARADRRRRIDDHGRQMFVGDHGFDQPLGSDLAALVGADAFVDRQSRRFHPPAAPSLAQRNGGDALRVDDALNAGCSGLAA